MAYAEKPMDGCGMGGMKDRGGEPGCCAMHDGKGMEKGQGMWGCCGRGHGGMMMMLCRPGMGKVLEQAGIGKSTIAKLEDMGKTARTACEGQMIKIKREDLNIKEQLLKDSPDMQAIQTSINNKAQIMADLEFSCIKMEQDIKALVSKDDRAKIMAALKEKRGEKMHEGKCENDADEKK
jgi:hypothetical protein